MIETLEALKVDKVNSEQLLSFTDLRERLGFNDYYQRTAKYRA